MILCLPVKVVVCVVLSIVGCPGVILYKGAWAPGVGMTGWDQTVAIFLTKAMGFCAGMATVPPCYDFSLFLTLTRDRTDSHTPINRQDSYL